MRKFFIENIKDNTATLVEDEVLHLTKVLRMNEGDEFVGLNGEYEYMCKVAKITKQKVDVEILEKKLCTGNPKYNICVYQGLAKGEKNQLIIQKLNELGISEVTFFESDFTVSKIKNEVKFERLARIAKESCKQCGRSKPLLLGETIKLKHLDKYLYGVDLILFLYEKAGENQTLSNYIEDIKQAENIAIIVGAEGGFSESEYEKLLALEKNFNIKCVSLGSRILRAETASIAISSFVSFIKDV